MNVKIDMKIPQNERLERLNNVAIKQINLTKSNKTFNNLKYIKVMPIFDTGQSLCCDKSLDEINFKDGTYKLFSNTNANFSDLLKYINLDNYDLNKLKDVPNILNNILYKYIRYTEMSEERINKITKGIYIFLKFTHPINA